MKCQICKKETDYLEKHHIVPKSRGGTDDAGNLIKICIDCHSKAHDVSFSRKNSGLIKEGIERYKKNQKQGALWLHENQDNFNKVYNMIMEIYDYGEFAKYDHIMQLIENNKITPYDLMIWHDTGVLKYKYKKSTFVVYDSNA